MQNQELIELIKNNQTEAAQKWLENFLKTEVTQAEAGEAMVKLASVYMEAENSLDKQYLAVLDGLIDALKQSNQHYAEMLKNTDLALLRSKISQS